MKDENIEDREPLDTMNMLQEGFMKNIGKTNIKTAASETPRVISSKPVNANTESLLMDLYDVRDSLRGSFGEIKLGSELSENVTTAINSLGSMICKLGGQADRFDPLAHVSGLQTPSLQKNAQRVIDNTKDAYSVEDATIKTAKTNDKSIIISFCGQDDKLSYEAVGTITPLKVWMGTEAIDYIHTPKSGKMSVKVPDENGHWIDKSKDYNITWELFEDDTSIVKAQKNSEKKEETKEEVTIKKPNNVKEDINDDFPINET